MRPIGAHAMLKKQDMTLEVILASPDGKQVFQEKGTRPVATTEQARAFGAELGEKIKSRAPAGLLGV
jgi:porphobilinogen deaminase